MPSSKTWGTSARREAADHSLAHSAVRTAHASPQSTVTREAPPPVQVPDEVSFYAHAAHLHDVHLIGEIGFNAGHSAVTMLFQTHHSVLVSFDIEELAYSKTSLEFVQLMYPNRLERIVGSSIETVPVFAAKDKRKFDLFAIDGMHNAEFPYMVRARMRAERTVAGAAAAVCSCI